MSGWCFPAVGWRAAAALLVLMLVLAGTLPGAGHRLNLTTSEVEWQVEGQTLDVTHRLHLDDALTLLSQLGAADGVLDLAASARLLNYVEANFSLRAKAGEIALEPIGAHIQGNMLFVYQRASLAVPPTALEVRNELLHDIQVDASNQVNLRVGDVVRSHTGNVDSPVAWLVLAVVPPNKVLK